MELNIIVETYNVVVQTILRDKFLKLKNGIYNNLSAIRSKLDVLVKRHRTKNH